MRFYILLVLLTSTIFCCKNRENQIRFSTDYFEFENNYWVNLHHFMYQRADSSQLRKLQEDGFGFIDIGESAIEEKISHTDREVLNMAIKYYKDNLIEKSLRRDLNGHRVWLQKKEKFKMITDTAFGKSFTEMLNKVSPVYQKYYWDVHRKHNDLIVSQHIETIDQIEEEVIEKMERLSLNTWPDSTKVRVDITCYANWAGAYTTSIPKMNIVLSTTDPSKTTSAFVETILHEGSHLLYLFGESPMRDKIYDMSAELGIKFPRNLWHASMFYLCGRATQDELSKLNIEHKMILDVNRIFSKYNTEKFRKINEQYYLGGTKADTLVKYMLNELKERPQPMGL
nr:hypothetical protein [uncultured Allomuricauda sp.]